jgi:hypothetical protein
MMGNGWAGLYRKERVILVEQTDGSVDMYEFSTDAEMEEQWEFAVKALEGKQPQPGDWLMTTYDDINHLVSQVGTAGKMSFENGDRLSLEDALEYVATRLLIQFNKDEPWPDVWLVKGGEGGDCYIQDMTSYRADYDKP